MSLSAELLSLQRYDVALSGCEEGFGMVAASVISSDVKLGETNFLLLLLYSCSLISFAITHTILRLSPHHYSQSCKLRAAQQRVSLFPFSKHLHLSSEGVP